MKKTLITIALFSLILPVVALADDVIFVNPLGTADLTQIIDRIIGFLLQIAVILAPLIFLIGGFMYLTSGGDPQKVSRGTKIMIYAAAGLLIMLLAKAFVGVLKLIIGVVEDGGAV